MVEIVATAWAWLGAEIVGFGARWLLVVVVMLASGGWFGWRYRDMKRRLSKLESEESRVSIVQTFNFRESAQDRRLELQGAMGAETTRSLQETIRSLPQQPLEGGHTYAELPHGTNLVSLADGSFRLAIPIDIEVHFEGKIEGKFSPEVTLVKAKEGENPEGRST